MIQSIVEVASIHGHDGARRKGERLGDTHIIGIAVGHKGPAGQAPLMIELQMEFDRALRPLKPSPIEHRGTQLDARRIQRPQGIFEPEPSAFQGGHGLPASEHLVEERLIQLPRAMGIGIRERRAGGRPPYPEVDQLAESGGQATADLPERTGAAHLTKQHRHALLPAAEPLGRSLGGMLSDGAREVRAIDQGEDLRKATGNGYHTIPPARG